MPASGLTIIGVFMSPGRIALTRTPWRAYSMAIDCVRPSTPALLAAYETYGTPSQRMPAIDEMLTMVPRPARAMCGSTARHVRYMLLRFTSTTRSHDSSLASTGPPTRCVIEPATPARSRNFARRTSIVVS